MPRVCTSQPAKAELQVLGSAAAGSTTAGIRGQQLINYQGDRWEIPVFMTVQGLAGRWERQGH